LVWRILICSLGSVDLELFTPARTLSFFPWRLSLLTRAVLVRVHRLSCPASPCHPLSLSPPYICCRSFDPAYGCELFRSTDLFTPLFRYFSFAPPRKPDVDTLRGFSFFWFARFPPRPVDVLAIPSLQGATGPNVPGAFPA